MSNFIPFTLEISRNSVQINSKNKDLPQYYKNNEKTNLFTCFCPDVQWNFTKDDNSYIIKFCGSLNLKKNPKEWRKPMTSGILNNQTSLLKKLENVISSPNSLMEWDKKLISPYIMNLQLRYRENKKNCTTCTLKFEKDSNWLKFYPTILISSYITQPKLQSSHKVKLSDFLLSDLNWAPSVDLVAPFMVELGYILKSRIIYPSLYPISSTTGSINHIVIDSNKVLVLYRSEYAFIFEVVSARIIKITNIVENWEYIKRNDGYQQYNLNRLKKMKYLRKVLQDYVDCMELNEEEFSKRERFIEIYGSRTKKEKMLEIQPQANQLPKIREKSFKLDYKNVKYLQPILKKFFDFLKCMCVKEKLRFGNTRIDCSIIYGNTNPNFDFVSVRLDNKAQQDEIYEKFKNINTFMVMFKGISLEESKQENIKNAIELFNSEIKYMSQDAAFKYLLMSERSPETANNLAGAYLECKKTMRITLELRDLNKNKQGEFELPITISYGNKMKIMIALIFTESRILSIHELSVKRIPLQRSKFPPEFMESRDIMATQKNFEILFRFYVPKEETPLGSAPS